MAWKSITFNVPASGLRVTKADMARKTGVNSGVLEVGAKPLTVKIAGKKAGQIGGAAAAKSSSDVKLASSKAVEKHRAAMKGLVLQAKKIAEDRRETLNSIQDPDLKRSAAS